MTVEDLLPDLLSEHAAGIHADPHLLGAVRTRAQRRQRTRRALTTAAAVATVGAAVVAVTLAAPFGHRTSPQTLQSATVQQPNAQSAPAFRLTPTRLPAGLGPAHTEMVANRTLLRYDPAGQVDSHAAITIQVGATAPVGIFPDQPSTTANVNGHPARVVTRSGLTNIVFTRAPGQIVALTGDGPYADPPVLLAVAASLTDQSVAATPPFELPALPANVGPLCSYDTHHMSFGANWQAPALSITYAPPTAKIPPPFVPPGAAHVTVNSGPGQLYLVSPILSSPQLKQIATDLTLTQAP